ncbi:MAG: cysteine--tRNA ligase [Butyricicoccus sp.]|nr:cysteine--tRNA ligase [Butyricicoccus sp.]
MKLYNSATRKKEELRTHTPGRVELYTCGPTVYHFAHIGNLRSYIMEDVLEKFLRWSGYEVNRVMNITDVGHLASDADEGEDKMLKGAKREHKSVMEIAKFYTDAFFDDCRKLNIKTPDVIQPATGLIDEFIRVISALIDRGSAYVAGGNVYFDTSTLKRYYIFNDFNEADLAVGVREGVEADANKRNKNDFVLWFTKSKFEDQALKWDSPWGVGYPGWHIECSCISMKYNGEYLDLHCGGIDNAFPHHTNEIAQSEAYLGHEWCPHWFHVHHLNTTSGKMSKSKGEFLTVSLLEEKGYEALVYRLFCLQSHYRKGLVFSWENLDNAKVTYDKLIAKIAALGPDDGEVDGAVLAAYGEKFRAALDNDLNTSMAVTCIYDALKAKANAATRRAILASYDAVLGLDLLKKADGRRAADEKAKASATASAGAFAVISESGEEDGAVTAKILERAAAKKAKNFAEADRIRGELKAAGIELTDIPNGAKWKRV